MAVEQVAVDVALFVERDQGHLHNDDGLMVIEKVPVVEGVAWSDDVAGYVAAVVVVPTVAVPGATASGCCLLIQRRYDWVDGLEQYCICQ